MKTHPLIPSPGLPTVMALGLTMFAAPLARASQEVAPQVVIEARIAETSQEFMRSLDRQGYHLIGNFNSSFPADAFQPRGITFTVTPPPRMPRTGDIMMMISPGIFGHGDHPGLRAMSLNRALTNVLRDLPLVVTPDVSSDRSHISLNLMTEVPAFNHWSVDLFGTAAFGQVSGTERVTRTVTTRETRTIDVPTKVLVPFDDGFRIVDREEIRLVPTKDINHRTRTLTERRDINRLGDFAGGGGLGVNFKFNPRFGVSLRSQIFGGRDTLGLVTASAFGEYDCCWPVTPTYSLGGGILYPHATAVLDAGLGLKKHVTPQFDLFTEAHIITNFGNTTFGEINVGASFPLGAAPVTTTYNTDTAAPETKPTPPGNVPVNVEVFRQKTAPPGDLRTVLFLREPRLR